MSNKYFITLRDNGVQYGQFTDKQYKFMKKCLSINEDERREFCCVDFPEMSPENFRQYILKLKNYLVVAIKSYPVFYQIKGVKLIANNYRNLSGTILGDNMLSLLNRLPRQDIVLQNLQMKVKIKPELFNALVNLGTKTIDSKDEILWERMEYDSEILTIVKITPEMILIKLEAKKQPIVYDMYGILRITKILGILEGHIRSIMCDIVSMPSVGDWYCISYRLGMNGQYEYNKSKDCITWKDFAGGLLRKYSEMGGKSDTELLIDTRR